MPINYQDFETSEARRANYLIDLFEGNQLKYVEQALNGGVGGGKGARPNWLKRGMIPRMRNIVRPIVEKSANLLDEPPKYEILPASDPTADPVVDAKFNEILAIADWQEFAVNLDNYTRLLGATCVLQERYIPGAVETVGGIYRFDGVRGDTMVPMLLHRGNCVVVLNQTRTRVIELAYLTKGNPDMTVWEYRVITPQQYLDFRVDTSKPEADRLMLIGEAPNLYGFVPANMWYDTSKPVTGAWPRIREDIISAQELLNTHITDMEFAKARGLGSTLFLQDLDVEGGEDESLNIVQETNDQGTKYARVATPEEEGLDLGIGSVVTVKTRKGATGSKAYFDSPKVDLREQAEIVRDLVNDVAKDWAVSMQMDGGGAADSGFKLVVKEMDNLQLRERRAQSFQAAFRRFYEVTRQLYPELTEGELQVCFAPPSLPVNKKEELELWVTKIENNLASHEDYFEAVEGLSDEEAMAKAMEVRMQNMSVADLPALLTLMSKGVITAQDLANEMKRRGVLAQDAASQASDMSMEEKKSEPLRVQSE